MNQVKIGKFIAELRKSKNMTQEQLGEKLGVSFKTISKWENGRGMPELSTLKPLSEELEISINELLSGEKIEKEKYQETFEENMLMAISYNNKINDKNNIIGYFLLIIGYLLILFGIVVFNHDSHFCSFSIIIGVLLTTFGFGNFIKKQKNSVKVVALIMYFVVFMGIMFTLDFVSVKYINNPPIFAHKITTGEESVLYETLFYDVYKYKLNLPKASVVQKISIKNSTNNKTVTSDEEIEDIIYVLSNSGKSRTSWQMNKESFSNTVDDKIEVIFYFEGETRSLFVYDKDGKYYIEQTDNGIYQISGDEYNSIQKYVR